MDKGYGNTSTEALIAARDRLLNGIKAVSEYLEAGLFEVPKKEGAAPPAQSGWLSVTILADIEDELEGRILGYERVLPLDLLKTL